MALGFTSHYNHKSDFASESVNGNSGIDSFEETTGSIASGNASDLLSGVESDTYEISAFIPLNIDPSLFAFAPSGDSTETTGSIAYSGFSSTGGFVSSSGGAVSCSSGGGFSSGSSSCSFSC